IVKWLGTCTDIHDLKEAELRIKRLSRVQSVLSHISSLNARARDHAELFDEVCRIAVEECDFRMAMICVSDADGGFVPAASAGKEKGLLDEIRQLLGTELRERTMIVRAARTRGAI